MSYQLQLATDHGHLTNTLFSENYTQAQRGNPIRELKSLSSTRDSPSRDSLHRLPDSTVQRFNALTIEEKRSSRTTD
jgi:hypothetical protein